MMKMRILCLLLPALLAAGCEHKAGPKAPAEKPAAEAPPPAEPETPAVPAEELIWVFEARGNRQCEDGGKTLEQSGATLSDSGVEIQESRCGVRTDHMYASVCGGETGDILLHLIAKGSLDAALELGFDPAEQIQYQNQDCPSGSP